MRSGAVTSFVAEKALNVTDAIVAGMSEATRSGRTSDIVATAIEIYRAVAQYVAISGGYDGKGESTEAPYEVDRLKRELKHVAGNFCDALTSNSAPNAAPVGSASGDFMFTCQKVQQRDNGEDSNQACWHSSVRFQCFLTSTLTE